VLDKEKELEEVVEQKEKRLLRLQQVHISPARFFAVINGEPSLSMFGRCSPQRALVPRNHSLSASFLLQPLTKPGENGEGVKVGNAKTVIKISPN
jgi:mitotic spindle assembly checkpoint protein MAD1